MQDKVSYAEKKVHSLDVSQEGNLILKWVTDYDPEQI